MAMTATNGVTTHASLPQVEKQMVARLWGCADIPSRRQASSLKDMANAARVQTIQQHYIICMHMDL